MTDDHYLDLCTKYNFNCIGRLILFVRYNLRNAFYVYNKQIVITNTFIINIMIFNQTVYF
jgi:hypothetical protein